MKEPLRKFEILSAENYEKEPSLHKLTSDDVNKRNFKPILSYRRMRVHL